MKVKIKIFDSLKDKEFCLKFFSFICIGIGIIFHIIPYFRNRSLWIDEAMLVKSILTRSLFELPRTALDFGQSAPLGYLYIVKIITMIFGNGEWQLRILSLLSFIGCLFLIYKILKNILNIKYSYVFVAIFSFIPYFIRYSNEAKPYMFDTFIILLVLYSFGLFINEKLSFPKFVFTNAICIWFSFSGVFFVGSSMIIVCAKILLQKIKNEITVKEFIKKYSLCLIVLVSFLLNYFLWLRLTKSNAGGAAYWNNLKYPLIPKSSKDIKLIYRMLQEIIYPIKVSEFYKAIVLLSVLRICNLIKNKTFNLFDFVVILSFTLLLVASYLGFYPIQARLIFFIPIVIFVFVSPTAEFCFENFNKKFLCCFFCILFSLGVLNVFFSSLGSIKADGTYLRGSEVKKSIEFLKENLNKDDFVYVRSSARPVFLYETEQKIKNSFVEQNQIIWGDGTYRSNYKEAYSYDGNVLIDNVLKEVEKIAEHDTVYIFSSHENAEIADDAKALIQELRAHGKVEIVSNFYDTYLYHFTSNSVFAENLDGNK